LIRHQNQRRMNTLPVPAPMAIRKVHAPAMDSWKSVTADVLSTACSVPPHASPQNVLALTEAAETEGGY
jgi:hypothetical protein